MRSSMVIAETNVLFNRMPKQCHVDKYTLSHLLILFLQHTQTLRSPTAGSSCVNASQPYKPWFIGHTHAIESCRGAINTSVFGFSTEWIIVFWRWYVQIGEVTDLQSIDLHVAAMMLDHSFCEWQPLWARIPHYYKSHGVRQCLIDIVRALYSVSSASFTLYRCLVCEWVPGKTVVLWMSA